MTSEASSTRQDRAASRPSQRVQQREDTRRALLVAARALFMAQGVEPVAMDRIAAAAGVSRATIYLHFSGKPVLLEALLWEDWAGQVRLFERLRQVDFQAAGQIEAWLSRVAEGMRRASDSFAIHRAAIGQNAELTLHHQRHREQLARLLLEAVGAGAVAGAARIHAELIVAEIEYLATAAAIGWTPQDMAIALPMVATRMRDFSIERGNVESHWTKV